MTFNNRGFALETYLIIAAVIGLTQLVPALRPPNWFKKGPPTAELVKAQKEAADAKAQAAALQGRVDALANQNEVKKTEQLNYTYEMVTGAITSNAASPDSTEKAITDAFLQRANLGFNAVLGKLDPALKAEVISIVAQLRSGDQEKIKAAQAMLAEKDKELANETAARVKIEADAVVVKDKLAVANNVVAAKTANETKLTAQVVSYADKSYAKEKEAGSLAAFGANLVKVIIVVSLVAVALGGLYLYRHLRSVGPVTLGNVIADIRSGIGSAVKNLPPEQQAAVAEKLQLVTTTAFDTHLKPTMQPAVKAAAAVAIP